ncbi:carboxyvinyl-carboxyphosphonate phosphorylmutase [Acuticoccus sediminis]|uniref:Carboxyvinyl-carboxyphosphonate phosphorylmutase n=1 Tax=Acuticoccus sediminis TaxID=2184697 RepID=A0A8B2P0R4_9HYPH|nr:isocitrate lyase/PEP mutase family protein [Acuticoccus sediminis]RAI01857.1 carboxyvinyl-carboxyphosphonate phosphorylmutase [Acuticoccus sediminis]
MSDPTPGARLRALLARPEALPAPGVADALAARLVAEAGFETVYMSGDSSSAVRLGMADVGLLTMSEMADNAARIVDASGGLPVIADADTGYGGPVNVRRTVHDYERAGVAALQMEDQGWPKRCGHLAGKTVIPVEEMVAKVKAAVDSRRDPDLVVIARTDAIAIEGFEAALDRAEAYREAGADVIFVEAPRSLEELAAIGRRFDCPLQYNASASGKTPTVPRALLAEMGYRLAVYPGQTVFAAIPAIRAILAHLRDAGTHADPPLTMATFREYNEIIGLPEIAEFEAAHGTPETKRVAF